MENQNVKLNEISELESVKALNEISMELLRHKKSDHARLFVVIILLVAMNIIQSAILAWILIRNNETVETVATTETITQDTEGDGNNVYQSGDSAQYVQEGKTEVNNDGQTNDSSQNDDNEIQAKDTQTDSEQT